MRIDLIASEPGQLSALALKHRLSRLLPSVDQCAVLSDVKVDATSSELVILLVDGGNIVQACQTCLQVCTDARRCIVLAAGNEGMHAQLESLHAVGATDLLYLPISDIELAVRVRRALSRISVPTCTDASALDPRLNHVIARSESFRQLLARLPTLAACNAGVLILGETGTGKEVFAHALHNLSGRAAKPWVPINCGAIPIDLVESELFGHMRGAYTTATTSRAGLVEAAEGGTLFLDDVDCLPLAAQVKLLRLLQEREYRPVGSNTLRRADIRVIAASNRDLAREILRGAFRQDLYYRINVLSLTLPPLRERREDIAALVLHFIEVYARQLHKPVPELAPQALRYLVQHHWPGNVRELQHTIERAVLLSNSSVLGAEDIQVDGAPAFEANATFRNAKAHVVRRFEREYIEGLLARCNGNITTAAREAGKHRRAFFELMRKHGIKFDPLRAGC